MISERQDLESVERYGVTILTFDQQEKTMSSERQDLEIHERYGVKFLNEQTAKLRDASGRLSQDHPSDAWVSRNLVAIERRIAEILIAQVVRAFSPGDERR